MKNTKFLYITTFVSILILHLQPSFAQNPRADWAFDVGGTDTDIGRSIATDASGNVYVVGSFQGNNVDFDPSGSTANSSAFGATDAYLVKYNKEGVYQWTVPFISQVGFEEVIAYDVAVDASGNVYVTGQFRGLSTNFGGISIGSNGTGNDDIFIAKYDSNGTIQWVKGIGGIGNDDIGRSITTDPSGNVYVTGEFRGTNVDFDPNTGTQNLSSLGNEDIFILKLNTDGEYQWAHAFGNSTLDRGNAIDVDNDGNVFITGTFTQAVDFDSGAGEATRVGSSTGDIFVLKLDTNGDYIWVQAIGGSNTDGGNGITVDLSSGDVLVTGYFTEIVDFDPGAGTENKESGKNAMVYGRDIFVLKLQTNGDYDWVQTFGQSDIGSDDEGNDITIDSEKNVYIIGDFLGNVDFDPGAGSNTLSSQEGTTDGFVLRLDEDGNHDWAFGLGETTNGDEGNGIAIDFEENIVVTGGFAGTVNFNPDGSLDLNSDGFNPDIYIVRYLNTRPEIKVTQGPTELNSGDEIVFNQTNVGDSELLIFTIENVGGIDLNIGTASLEGANSSDFMFTDPSITLNPSGSVNFNVTFIPTAGGTREATLSIVNDDSDENPFTIDLTGEGVVPQPEIRVTLNETEYTFGANVFLSTVSVGNSEIYTFTIENTGTADLNLTGSAPNLVEITGTNASEFTISTNPSTPIAASGSTTFEITFTPSDIGSREAILSIPNNDSDENPFILNIQSSGGDPELTLLRLVNGNPVNIDEDNVGQRIAGVIPNGETQAATFGIFNSGTGSLVISSAIITEDVEDNFRVSNVSRSIIEPDSVGNFSVAFTPVTQGLKSAKVVITNNDADENPKEITLFAGYDLNVQTQAISDTVAALFWTTNVSDVDHYELSGRVVLNDSIKSNFEEINNNLASDVDSLVFPIVPNRTYFFRLTLVTNTGLVLPPNDIVGIATSDLTLVLPPTGLEDEWLSELIIYPNPSEGLFQLEGLPIGELDYSLRDSQGKLLFLTKSDFSDGHLQLDLRSLPAGIYYLELQTSKGSGVLKLMKQ